MSVQLVIQQCESASLQLPDPDGHLLTISRGMVVYVCFMGSITEEIVKKSAKTTLSVKLSQSEETLKRVCVTFAGGDVMVIPQFTLGGKLKGNSVQYHGNVKKEEGEGYYKMFCDELRDVVEKEDGAKVVHGMYGARQVLSMVTNGPFTHSFKVPE